jgi:hypothetical protein
MLFRWQVLPGTRTSADGAVKRVELVKTSDLDRMLPRDVRKVSQAQRAALLRERSADYARRYGPAG